jgi:diguanylate cyclase (GGDEF)-like protein/PAS domain S-box-containing protein
VANRIPLSVVLRRILATLAALLGVGVMAAWLVAPQWVRTPVPHVGLMVFNTALCIALLGCAAAFLDTRRQNLIFALGAAACVIAVWSILEHVGYAPFLIDLPDLHRPLPPSYAYPGRMVTATSLALLLLGAALVLWRWAGRSRTGIVIQVFVLFSILIAIAGLMLRDLNLDFLYNRFVFTAISVPTSAGILLIGTSLWLGWHHAPWNFLLPFSSDEARIVSAGTVILAAIAIAVGATALFVYDKSLERTLAENQQQVLLARSMLVATTLEQRSGEAKSIAMRPETLARMRDYGRSAHRADDAHALASIANSWLHGDFRAVAFYDAAGMPIASAGQFLRDVESLTAAEKPERLTLLWKQGLHLQTEVDIRDGGRRIGKMVTEQVLDNLTETLFFDMRGGSQGVIELCVRSGSGARCLPTGTNNAYHSYPAPQDGEVLPIHRALAGQTGGGYSQEPGSKLVYASYGPVGDFGLGLVVKTSVSELKTPVRIGLQRAVPVALLLVMAGVVLLRYLVDPLARRLATRERQLKLALEASHLALWDLDVVTRQMYLNEQWSLMLGGDGQPGHLSLDDLVKRVHPEDLPAVNLHLAKVLKGEIDAYEIEHRVRTDGGTWLWMHFKGKVIARDKHGKALRMAGTGANISDRKMADERLSHQASHDSLTGLPNRSLFFDRLAQAMARSRRTRTSMAVLYLDIDKFKQINDNFGHDSGDLLLQQFSGRLTRCVRATDTVARLGGDEFVVLFESLASDQDSRQVAEKIIAVMQDEFALSERSVRVTTSVGIASFGGDIDLGPDELVSRADKALYAAKHAGRNTYSVA